MLFIIQRNSEFYTFIKYIEEYINDNNLRLNERMKKVELVNLCMPCHSRAFKLSAPDPVEVMLFFEMIDLDKSGTIRVEELAECLSEVECFVASGWNYHKYIEHIESFGETKAGYKIQLDKVIGELSLTDEDYLTPEEFYNFIAAVMEVAGFLKN